MMKMEVAVNDVWATDSVLSLFPSLYWGEGGGRGELLLALLSGPCGARD